MLYTPGRSWEEQRRKIAGAGTFFRRARLTSQTAAERREIP